MDNITLEQLEEILREDCGFNEFTISLIKSNVEIGASTIEKEIMYRVNRFGEEFIEKLAKRGITINREVEEGKISEAKPTVEGAEDIKEGFDEDIIFPELDLDAFNFMEGDVGEEAIFEDEKLEEDVEIDIEDWKRNVEKNFEDFEYTKRYDYDNMQEFNKKLRLLREISSEIKYSQNDDEVEYLRTLESILELKLFQIEPAKFISNFMWGEKHYNFDEAREIVEHDIIGNRYLEAFDQMYKALEDKYNELNSYPNSEDEHYKFLDYERAILEAKCTFLKEKYEEHFEQREINIDEYHKEPVFNPEQIAEKHTAYIEGLLTQVKAIQEEQVQLLSSYGIGNLKENPKDKVSELKHNFNYIIKKIALFKEIGAAFEIKLDDKKLEQQADGIIKATGEDIVSLMDDEQRYDAKIKIYSIENGEEPNWLEKAMLKFANKDELIASYIDKGEFDDDDIRYMLGYSKEELGVRKKVEKIIAAAREKQEKENNDLQEIMDKFDELSTPEVRVETYAKLFGLDEKGKEVFKLFDSLSPEGKKTLWQKMYGDTEQTKDYEKIK